MAVWERGEREREREIERGRERGSEGGREITVVAFSNYELLLLK